MLNSQEENNHHENKKISKKSLDHILNRSVLKRQNSENSEGSLAVMEDFVVNPNETENNPQIQNSLPNNPMVFKSS
jgi:hypothetical protein